MNEGAKIKVLGEGLIATIHGDKYVRVSDLLLFLYKCKKVYGSSAYDSLIGNCEDIINGSNNNR